MSAPAATEREYKFDVDADFDPPDLRPVVGRTVRLPEIRHRTTYFDTADYRLWGRGVTLRHRRALPADDGGPGEWTLKLPVDGPAATDAGPELSERSELSWPGPAAEVPDPARRILAGVVRRAPLTTVAELTATRRRLELHGPDADGPWAEIDDDLVTVDAGPNTGHRFRQIEVELAGGDPPAGVVEQVLDHLRAAGAAPGGGSILGASLVLGVEPPARTRPPGRRTPLTDVVRTLLGADVGALLDYDYRLRQAAVDGVPPGVELIHQARVASRRVRAHLRTLDPVLDPVWVGHVRADLRAFGRALGRARDADVLTARLRAHSDPEDRDGTEELIHLVTADRALAVAELAELMAGDAYTDMVERLTAAAASPPMYSPVEDDPAGLPAGPTLHRLVRQRWRRVAEDLAGLGREPDPAALHQVRIRAKRLRYAAEAAEPYLGDRARRTARTAKRLQDVLGEIHDATVAAAWLRQIAAHPSITPAAAFVAGRIAGQAEGAAPELARRWPKLARELRGQPFRSYYR